MTNGLDEARAYAWAARIRAHSATLDGFTVIRCHWHSSARRCAATAYNPAMDPVAEIKKLYYGATKATIQKDVERAIDLLKTLPTEDERERVAVYMDGLSQMRSEWAQALRGGVASASPNSGAYAPRGARPPARSGPSKASSRRSR